MASHAWGNRLTDDGTDDEQRDGKAASLSKDDAFHLLQNGRRPAVLRYLLATEATSHVHVRDVAAAVAAWESGTTPQQVDADDRQPHSVGVRARALG